MFYIILLCDFWFMICVLMMLIGDVVSVVMNFVIMEDIM